MKNLIICCIVFPVFLFAILWSCPAKADIDSVVKTVQPATVKIYVFDQAGNAVCQGSGFFYQSYGHLITNYHVLGKAAKARVKTPDGREFNVQAVVAEDATDDLIEAVVDVSVGSVPYLTAAGTAPKAGDPVMVIGSPLGVDKVVSQGNVDAIMTIPKFGRGILHSAHSFPGSSGSPLVNAQGEVIGIETAAVPGRPNINFAVPVERFSGLSSTFRELSAAPSANTPVRAEVQRPDARPGTLEKDMQMAEAGDPAAQVRVAVRYERGQEVSQDCFEALDLYRKAADQGYLMAQYHLGRMYYTGECMGKDLGEAARWLQTASERGSADAQQVFGKMCFNGEGVARDRVTACMWMILAASRGNAEANNVLRLMASDLTRDEFNMAREKARNWKPGM
ncbi:MAG: trypsin-like peptidase domain-containing protein [Syntrophobacteraceae bacterium]